MALPLLDNHAFVWGINTFDCLGLGDDEIWMETSPQKLTIDSAWTQVACGFCQTIALSRNGDVLTWGYIGYYSYDTSDTIKVPTKVTELSNETVVKIACGLYHRAVVTSNGKLFTWYAK